MSSHREAPSISKDPVADNTDVYAFVSPDRPDTVTLIANFIPFEEPAGGPNFYRFGDDVLYSIHVDNDGDGHEDISFDFRFTTKITNPDTFLYNTGPIGSLTDPNWNLRQTYEVGMTRANQRGRDIRTVLGHNLATPPVRIGPRSTPNYEALAATAIGSLPEGVKVFAGQREDGFFVDTGSIFDLGTLRPFQALHLIPSANAAGADGLRGFNVHTIALQVPKQMLTATGIVPTKANEASSTIGVWATASRQKVLVRNDSGDGDPVGPWMQVSRLANPLINEVLIPIGTKDEWNGAHPSGDSEYAGFYEQPELAQLLPVLYPDVFPNLAALNASGAARADLVAILLTGVPGGLVDGFQNNTGAKQADMLRLNMAIPPATSPSPLGVIGGDPAGYPNGRRVFDDTVAISLRAVAGALYPLIDSAFTPDEAAAGLVDGTTNDKAYLPTFPYLGTPHEGYAHQH